MSRRPARLLNEHDLVSIQQMLADLIGGGSGLETPAVLLAPITFSEARGGIPAGTTFPVGTSHDVILAQLAKAPVTNPIYAAPILSLASNAAANPEVGSVVSLALAPTWTKNDAGNPTAYVLKKNDSNLHSASTPAAYTESSVTIGSTAATYQASVTYAAGPIKNNSEGTPYPNGAITAGTVNSNTLSLIGVRYGFYDTDTNTAIPATSAEVRALSGVIQGVAVGKTFTINAPIGARRITLWYPATLRDVSSIKYVEQGNAEYKDEFTKTLVNVEGAGGFTAIPYKGFTWTIALPLPSPMTLNVTV